MTDRRTPPPAGACHWCKLNKPFFEKNGVIWHDVQWAGIIRCTRLTPQDHGGGRHPCDNNPPDRPATEPRPFCRDCGHWEHDPGSCDGLGHIFNEDWVPVVTDCTCEAHNDDRAAQGAAPRITADDVRVAAPGEWVDAEGIAEAANEVPLWSEGAAPRAEGLPQPGIDMTPEQQIEWWQRAAYSEAARAERAEDEVQRCRAERDAIADDEQAAVDELLAAPRAEGLDGVIRDVLALVIKHSLSHQTDPLDLAVAIEFLKAVRDEGPERIAALYERWADEIGAAR